MKKIISIFVILLIFGCSPQKRVARIVKHHPELLKSYSITTIVRDTIVYSDTFYYPGIVDSFSINASVKDTTILKAKYRVKKTTLNGKEHFKFTVYRDTFYKTDTLYKELKVTVPGKAIDLTPKWIYLIKENWTYLAFLTLSLTLIILYKNKSGGS